jgi:hypothetical protein
VVTLIIGLVVLPFLLWSWRRTGNDEDASVALGIIAWVLIAATAGSAYFLLPV